MANPATSTAIQKTPAREWLVPRDIEFQCAWCFDWIHKINENERRRTVAVSHGLCSDCFERLKPGETHN